ncbi:MAG: alpha-N-arabinofuranosidase, partial [Alistipes sp.]|nr:alpha-N-arabinofuranosidase [Alistipes sp.]
RDAMVAALTFHVFHRYADRVRMANIAQIANVLQSVVLTRGEEMVLTPTYHAFYLYKPHMGATVVPVDYTTTEREVSKTRRVPALSATASRATDGSLNISLVNPDLEQEQRLVLQFDALQAQEVQGALLTADKITDYNDFGRENKVGLAPFKGAKVTVKGVEVTLPAKSIVTLSIR